jgi:hypothetical protein
MARSLKMKYRLIVLFLMFLVPSIAHAGGSVSWDEVRVILNQEPQIANIVYSTLDCKSSGYTEYRIGGMYPLGGKRLGPYQVPCRLRGTTTDYNLLLIVNTKYTMYDDTGKEVDVDKATKIDERFVSIQIGVYKGDSEKP